MRRRVRFLRKARELAYRDLGGLVFNLHRFGQRNDALVMAKLSTLSHIDAELRSLETALEEHQPVTVLREAGITACPRCAAIHSGEDRFCPNCGLPVSRHVDLPIASAPGAAAAPRTGPAGGTPAVREGAAGAAAAPATSTPRPVPTPVPAPGAPATPAAAPAPKAPRPGRSPASRPAPASALPARLRPAAATPPAAPPRRLPPRPGSDPAPNAPATRRLPPPQQPPPPKVPVTSKAPATQAPAPGDPSHATGPAARLAARQAPRHSRPRRPAAPRAARR